MTYTRESANNAGDHVGRRSKDAGESVRMVCCVDDTDDLSGSTSTGYVAEQLALSVVDLGGSIISGITRHQLLIAEGVPYTSHNSAMCFMANLPEGAEEEFLAKAYIIVERESVAAADPGLCVVYLPNNELVQNNLQEMKRIDSLIEYGETVQNRICTKETAYAIADSVPWVHLSEHGGTGDGIIGALAGVGLRLSGDDGRFRGKWNLREMLGMDCDYCEAALFCKRMSELTGGKTQVVDPGGNAIESGMLVALANKAKPILRKNALTFVATLEDNIARPVEKDGIGAIGDSSVWDRSCYKYEQDNDIEECTPDIEASCRNCLYRRWTENGFACVEA